MLSKKILGLLIAASALAPLTTAIVEAVDPECVQAATEFIDVDTPIVEDISVCVYGMPPYYFAPDNIGDVNNDGEVNISDYTLLKKYLQKGDKIKINKEAADLNMDGSINYTDLEILKDFMEYKK